MTRNSDYKRTTIEKALRQYNSNNNKKEYNETITNLYLHIRHEQKQLTNLYIEYIDLLSAATIDV